MVSTMSLIGKEIGELLVDSGLLTPDQLEIAEQEKLNTGETISRVLTRMGLASENQIKDTLELQYGVTYVSLSKHAPKAEIVNLLPEKLIRQHQVLPIDYQNGRLTLAMVNPDDPLSVIDIKNHIEVQNLKTVVCMEDEFESFVEAFFAPPPPPEPEMLEQAEPEQPEQDTAQPEVLAESEALATPATEPASTTDGAVDLGDLLVSEGILDDDQLFSALKRGLKEKKELSEVLIQMKLVTRAQIDSLMQKGQGLPTDQAQVSAETIGGNGKGAITKEPVNNGKDGGDSQEAPSLGALDQTTSPVTDKTAAAKPVFERMRRAVEETHFDLNAAFGPLKVSLDEITSPDPIAQFGELEDDIDFLQLVKQAEDASISLVANHITSSAVESKCSDIHIHGTTENVVVQYFCQGNLINESRLEKQLQAELVACFKDIAGLNRAETVKPQDKRIRMRVLESEVELRITTIPEEQGEMVAITLKYLV
jgi:type II secretory ATPase GspE/PulE/Tfp pilus assembly ATPase PilB-like protein